MAVKESGFGELIPNAEVIIFDEAHQLPDIASQYFGQSLTSLQLLIYARILILSIAQSSKICSSLAQHLIPY